MAKVNRGATSRRKHKKILKLVQGHKGGRSKLIKQARESLLHSGQYAFEGRKQRKRDMRRLWIVQLGNAVREQGLSYSKFISQMKAKNIILDRKMLAEIAVKNPEDFKKIISQVTA